LQLEIPEKLNMEDLDVSREKGSWEKLDMERKGDQGQDDAKIKNSMLRDFLTRR
jgi:hypothetical protein